MLLKYILAALCLAFRIFAVPPGKIILGYRTVKDEEAVKIIAAGAPVFEVDVNYGGGRQLGPGVYTSPTPGAWRVYTGKQVCVIYADEAAHRRVSKVWVPYWDLQRRHLWYGEANVLAEWVRHWGFDWNPERTLYMSWVQDIKGQLQLLIPPELVAASGALGLSAVCTKTVDELPDKDPVDYDTWTENIRGLRGPEVNYNGDPI